VWIELPHRTLRVTAQQLEGARRQQAWTQIVQAQPRYAKYQERTDRLLPIIHLVPLNASGVDGDGAIEESDNRMP